MHRWGPCLLGPLCPAVHANQATHRCVQIGIFSGPGLVWATVYDHTFNLRLLYLMHNEHFNGYRSYPNYYYLLKLSCIWSQLGTHDEALVGRSFT